MLFLADISPLREGYTFQATQAKSKESKINIYTTTAPSVPYNIGIMRQILPPGIDIVTQSGI